MMTKQLNNEYLEYQILGCFMKDNNLLKETILQPHHFCKRNKSVYESMLQMMNEGKAIDRVSLMTEKYDVISKLGGPNYIMSMETTGYTENFETYEKTLISNYKEEETKRIVKDWLASGEDNQTLISDIQKVDEEGITDESDVLPLLVEMHEEPYGEITKDMTGIPSGFKALDKYTGGWQPQTSTIMGARPSMGKTATMLKFTEAAMLNGDVPLVFSLEMSTKSLLRRMVTAMSGLNAFRARTPQLLTEEEKQKWTDTVGKLSNMSLEIYDKPMQTIQYIRTKVRQAKKKYEGKRIVVLIDYLTLISNNGKFNSDHGKVSDTSARLKAIAKEYNCPVITLAQLSRGVESRPNKRPMLSDLRESGSIEQDADVILFLYRDSYYQSDAPERELEINIAKHRDGPTAQVKVEYKRQTGEMGDLY